MTEARTGSIRRIAASLLFLPAALLTQQTSTESLSAQRAATEAYRIVDTGQAACCDASSPIACPSPGQPFCGQDAQITGRQPSFTLSPDGLTVRDSVTGLTWQHSPDTNGNGILDPADKLTWGQAQGHPATLNVAAFGGYTDWRLPTIKELYSLIDFRGTDPSVSGDDISGLTPFIDRTYFDFAYGDPGAGERIIDSQYASATLYTSDGGMLFGVNFAEGRIKGYGLTMPGGREKTFFVQCVRGNAGYGLNAFADNGDGTVTDRATGLMWSQPDSGTAMTWQDALAWVQARNAERHLGHDDWRLPNAKELQSIVDYTRSPVTTASAALDPVFRSTAIADEDGTADFPWYWTGTTHASSDGSGPAGVYVTFGRALGWMQVGGASCYSLVDVHGAGAQRSDPKSGEPAASYLGSACGGGPAYGSGPQGDVIRIHNFVRLVRDSAPTGAHTRLLSPP